MPALKKLRGMNLHLLAGYRLVHPHGKKGIPDYRAHPLGSDT